MATGSQNMTTFNAKHIIGDSTNADWAGALLHSGRDGKTSGIDTWIFADDYGSASSTYGILHHQSDDKIIFIGASTNRFWNDLNTGDTYIGGKLGINYDPETSGNSYQLYVNGTSNLNGTTSINGTLTTAGAITAAHNSAHLYLKNTQWTKGTTPSSQSWSAVEYLSNDSSNNRVALLETTLDTSGNSQFNIFLVPNVANSTSWSGITLQKTNANVLTVSIAGSTSVTGSVGASTNITAGTYVYAGTYLQAKTHVYSDTGHFYMKYNNTWYSVLHNHGNGNISVEAASGGLYIGYSNTTLINWLNGKMSLDSNGNLTMKNDIYYQGTKSNYRMIRFLDNTASTDGNGIIIGGAGYVGIGSGESGNQSYTGGGYSAGSETLVLSSDGDIRLLPTQQDGYNVAYETLVTTNGLWVGREGNTTREMDIGVRSGAGSLCLWSHAAVAGERGLWLPAHGSGKAYALVCADTNNISYLQGHRIGIKNTDAASGYGLSLYNGQYNGVPEYGMFFGGTGTFGKFGDVSADWATYFTMNRNDTRGWIFKSNGTSKNGNYNVASISGRGHFTGSLSPSSWIDGQRYMYAAYNIADYSNTGAYNPWMRATNTWSSGAENAKVGRWFSFGTLGTSFYWIGSTTGRTENSYDYGMTYNISNGVLTSTRMDCSWLRVINDSSNNSDDATVYIQSQTANDWALKIVKGGKNYGIRVDSLDQGEAIWTNGYVRARCVWANQGSNGERQVGVDSGTSGNLYFYAHTTGKGIYSGSGYSTGSILSITSSGRTLYCHDTWGDKVRIVSNWVGFYGSTHSGTRYGYIQADADRMYFRKENGVSTFGFDFNSHLYTTGHYYASNAGPHLYLAVSDLTNVKDAKNGLSANREQGMACYSKDYGSWMGDFAQGYTQSNGQIWSRLYLRNYKTDGSTVNNYIYLYADKNGTTSYAIANQTAFRSAISAPSTTGSGASGTWDISITGNCSGSAGSVAWSGVSGKPATATRWPSWSEVTSKPAVQNNLTSTSTTDMLSAAQGRALNNNKTEKGTGLAYTTLLNQTYSGTSFKSITVSNISSYNALHFACYFPNWWRGSMLIPVSEFKSHGVTIFFMINNSTPEYANFKYISDTSIQISTDHGHSLVFRIWGAKTS